MINFFKIVFGSCLGVLLAVFLFIGIASIIGASAMKFGTKKESVEANTVLHIEIQDFVPEQTNNVQSSTFDFQNFDSKSYGVHDIVKAIDAASEDKKIKGVTISNKNVGLGMVKATLIRDALQRFKDSGKFVYSYGDSYSTSSYYLASVADKVILHPLGLIDLRGYGITIEYYTDLLKKLDVEVEVYYAGRFKSATEPFRRTDMSEENRIQIRQILQQRLDAYTDKVCASRSISSDAFVDALDNFSGRNAQSALRAKLIDEVGYSDQMLDLLRSDLDLNKEEDIEAITLDTYLAQIKDDKDYAVKEKIALVYAEGEILGEEDSYGSITQDAYVQALRDIRKDDKIKALVLRVDSPGGSVMTSDNIWRELSLFRQDGKPVVVSMGNYAASGGYYISCASDSIFAEANTITGSIGVFGMFVNLKNFYNNKLHISFDTVEVNRYATDFTGIDDRSSDEKEMIQHEIEAIYDIFLTRVAENRGMTKDEVNEVAQGRVWTGSEALKIGLVDRIAGLDEALASAASLADLEKYRIAEYPKLKDPIEKIIEDITGQETMVEDIRNEILSEIPLAHDIHRIKRMSAEPQARLLYNFDPR